MWNQVRDFEEKGKIDKPIKVFVSELIELRETITDLEKKFAKSQGKVNELKEKFNFFKNAGVQSEENINADTSGISDLKKMIKEKDEKLKAIQQDFMKKEILFQSQSQKLIEKYKQSIKQKDDMIFNLEKSLKSSKPTIIENTSNNSEKDKEIARLQETIKEMEGNFEAIAQLSVDQHEDDDRISGMLVEKDSEIAQLKKKIESLTKNNKVAKSTIKTSAISKKNKTYVELEKKLVQTENLYKSTQQRLKEMEDGNENLQKYIQQLQTSSIQPDNALSNELKELKEKYNYTNLNYEKTIKKYKKLEVLLKTYEKKFQSLDSPQVAMKPAIISRNSSESIPKAGFAPQKPPKPIKKGVSSGARIGRSASGRLVCPLCDSPKIKLIEDKSRVISYVPRVIYAKKHLCSNCGHSYE